MTKEELVDQVYLNVNGGNSTTDNSVERLDISSYFRAALSSAIEAEYEARSVYSDRKGEDYIIDEEFVQQFELETKEEGCLKYAVFSPRYLGLPDNGGVRNVFNCDFSCQFVKMKSLAQLQGVNIPGKYCWFGERNGEQRVYLRGEVDKVVVEIVVHPDDIKNEDRIVAPGEVIDSTIIAMVNFFRPQKISPKDVVANATDAAEAVQPIEV